MPPDMRAELDRFDSEAEAIIAAFVGPMDSLAPPPVIYHYTNDAGLKGILESGTTWLTDMFDLNDPSEVRHGFSHAVNALNAKAASGPPESKLFARQLEAFNTQGGIQAAAHYFVCSFSANGDDLGQWRAYADNGGGYALGFDAKPIEDAYTKKDGTPPRGRNLESDVIRGYMSNLSVLVSLHCLRAALFFKHEAYRNEQEYRFMQLHRADVAVPDVNLRARRHSLVKYREFDWKAAAPAALRRIVIGPAADFEKSERFARECLAAYHPRTVEIVRSEIPYRAV
jgi:Protein of unknown function (DUF2971)